MRKATLLFIFTVLAGQYIQGQEVRAPDQVERQVSFPGATIRLGMKKEVALAFLKRANTVTCDTTDLCQITSSRNSEVNLGTVQFLGGEVEAASQTIRESYTSAEDLARDLIVLIDEIHEGSVDASLYASSHLVDVPGVISLTNRTLEVNFDQVYLFLMLTEDPSGLSSIHLSKSICKKCRRGN